MSTDEWEKIEHKDAADVMEDVNPYIHPIPFSLEMTRLSVSRLSFYEDYKLYKMTNFEARHGVTKYTLRKPGHAVVINWTAEPIYKINKIAPVQINENNVVDYIKFFFTYVRDRERNLQVIEKIEDLKLNGKQSAQLHFNVMSKIGPVSLESVDSNEGFDLLGYLLSCNTLVKSRIRVKKTGTIILSDEEKIMNIPPARNHAPFKVEHAIRKARSTRKEKEDTENE